MTVDIVALALKPALVAAGARADSRERVTHDGRKTGTATNSGRNGRARTRRNTAWKRGATSCVWLAAVAVLVLFGSALADDFGARSRLVKGRVEDAVGEPVRGAAVQIQNMLTMNIRSFITQRGGKYHFAELWSNVDYQLRAEHHGVFGPVKTLSRFDGRKKATIDLTCCAIEPGTTR
jgi:hypothetical protein